MTEQTIRLTIDGTTATITVDRPKALNALNTATLDQLEEALAAVAQQRELRGLIVTGAGEKAFVAGADIAEMMDLNLEQSLAFAARGHRVFDAAGAPALPDARRGERLRARAAAASSRWPATASTPPRRRSSACPRSAWASSPASAAPSG